MCCSKGFNLISSSNDQKKIDININVCTSYSLYFYIICFSFSCVRKSKPSRSIHHPHPPILIIFFKLNKHTSNPQSKFDFYNINLLFIEMVKLLAVMEIMIRLGEPMEYLHIIQTMLEEFHVDKIRKGA